MTKCSYCRADLSAYPLDDFPKQCPKCGEGFTVITPTSSPLVASIDAQVWRELHELAGEPLPDKPTPILGLGAKT